MDDLISRHEAIKAICEDGTWLESQGCTEITVAERKQRDADIIGELPSAQPEPHWIPCSERLPEKPYGCLVTVWDTDLITMDEFENILPYFVGWDGEQWNDADGEQCQFEVIAWMPLPKPYERKEE